MLSAAETWGRGLMESSRDSLAAAAPAAPELQRERLNPQATDLQARFPCISLPGNVGHEQGSQHISQSHRHVQDTPAVSKREGDGAGLPERKPVRRLMTSMTGHSRGMDPGGGPLAEKAAGRDPIELGAQPTKMNGDATQAGAELRPSLVGYRH